MLLLSRFHNVLTEATGSLSAVLIAIMTLTFSMEVVARYFLGSPLNWSSDLTRYLLCMSVFLALPLVTREQGHIAVSFVVDRMSGSRQQVYSGILSLLTALVCLIAAWFVVSEGTRQFVQHDLTYGSYQIPRWWLTLLVFYGLFSSAIYFFKHSLRCFSQRAAQ